jgi:hypothetical protein
MKSKKFKANANNIILYEEVECETENTSDIHYEDEENKGPDSTLTLIKSSIAKPW